MYNPHKRGGRLYKTVSLQDALEFFFARHPDRANFHLAHLWENWNMVMGEYLGKTARPLGARDRTLLVGADDNMLMHELSFYTQEILSRANAFMREEYFTKVRFSLLQDRVPLYPPPPRHKSAQAPDGRPKPENLGKLSGVFDPESPIGRAYASYVKSFEG
ncbi:MAG: DUF721 domain-containing protein [Deltaproteobacteria bacterium]|jgi:hypothetical protein|nr:DUF721 domain-containing protein [Deltaproteobacteria bacterium]